MQEDNHSILPYTWTEEYSLSITSGSSDRQLMRCSWPLGISARLLSARISNISAASAGHVILWDQDLSNSTPSTRGSAGGALVMFGVGGAAVSGVAATTIEYGIDGGPTPDFDAGIAMQSTIANMHISVQVLHHR